jgi:hypothetical protein
VSGLPEITAVERLEIRDGDTLVIHLDRAMISVAEARDIERKVREITGRPALPVLILPAGSQVEVLSDQAG